MDLLEILAVMAITVLGIKKFKFQCILGLIEQALNREIK